MKTMRQNLFGAVLLLCVVLCRQDPATSQTSDSFDYEDKSSNTLMT